MFRLWGKIFKDTRLIQDVVIEDTSSDTRTHKIFHAIDEICMKFDISHPIWLESNIKDFKKHNKVRFISDNFIDGCSFSFLPENASAYDKMPTSAVWSK